jgi:capsular polysaccharide biosynthesis protein
VHNAGAYYLDDVLVNHENLIFRRGRIYPEAFMARMYYARHAAEHPMAWFLVKNYLLRWRSEQVGSGIWAIDTFTPDNYHHWMVDVLPRLVLAEGLYPEERLLLLPRYYTRQPYVHFTLQAFPRIEVRWISARAKLHVGRLAFVPRPPVYVRELIRDVADRVASRVDSAPAERRIYFSRADAPSRRAHNEREVSRVLESYDFETVTVDPRAPGDQVRIAREASVIAGVHGAALTNLIFMAAGGQLLELRHGDDRVFVRSYSALASLMGIGYRAQICQPAREASGYELNDADLAVDLDLLRENLEALTAKAS